MLQDSDVKAYQRAEQTSRIPVVYGIRAEITLVAVALLTILREM